MSSWETTALRLQGNVTADSTPSSLDKSLPLLPKRNAKARTTTGVKEVSPEEKGYRTKGWKPLSLSTPILLAVIALTILLAIAIETLAQRSAAQGGLALSPTLPDIPGYAKFSYLYVPTIIAVLYSLIWSWIDLDVKRMQPWFELSKDTGATGGGSLFLDYQYEFVALVPFKAAKSRHWPSFFAGTAMVIVFWALTPLQSAVLGTDVVSQTKPANIYTRSRLLPLSQQTPLFNPQILNTAYAIGWLNQSLPRFTTSQYALLPFYVNDTSTPSQINSNWTTVTTRLSTELDCWPAEVGQDEGAPNSTFYFLNGQGCKGSMNFGATSKVSMQYIGFYGSPYSDYALNSPKCPPTKNSTHQFLAAWVKTTPVEGRLQPSYNFTAFYCQPQYYKQRVLATVLSSTFEPRFEALSPREILPASEFNSTAFEFLLANGVEENIVVRDFPFNRVVEQTPRLNITNLTHPVSNMIGFAMAGHSIPLDDYSSFNTFTKALNDAHQYVFSAAISSLLMNETGGFNRTATVEFHLTGVVVSRTFAIAVEATLLLVASLTSLTLWYCRKIPSNLPMNPSSIRRHIDIFRNNPHLLKMFQPMDSSNDKDLAEEFQYDRFRLLYDHQAKSAKISVEDMPFTTNESKENTAPKGYYEPVKPLVLRKGIGLLFVAVLIGAIIVLSYFKQQEMRLNGLHRPSENFEVLQLLENYIPTVFATLIEPLWVLLTRLLCVLQPFRDLWAGKAEPSHSIDATYTSIPPQLVFWRAIKSKHFILALVCSMAFLANLLAVGMGSLFNEAPATALYPTTMRPAYAARFDNSSVYDLDLFLSQNLISTTQYSDHLYIASANFSSGTALPPWVTKDYYFQRHNFTSSNEGNPADTFSLEARGFGVNANCSAVPKFQIPVFKTAEEFPGGESLNKSFCRRQVFIDNAARDIRENMANRTQGLSSAQFCHTLISGSGYTPCDKTLTLGWARTANAENINGTMHTSMLVCYPVFETAMFNVTIDRSGNVLSYNKTTRVEGELNYDESRDHTDRIFETYNRQWNTFNTLWQNDTVARDWFNYLIVVLNGSRSAIDPEQPVPNPEALRPIANEIYRRLYPIFLSLNEHLFVSNGKETSITVFRSTEETRIFMENASFIITMAVLALNTVVAIVFYSRSVAFVLPRMPTTVGSILAYVAPSRLASQVFLNAPGQASRTLSFGRYIGVDGSVHLGIESDPHVVHVSPSSLESGEGFFGRMRKKLWRRKNDSNQNGTWI
ncbi:uncharacterized protein FFUJ_13281 [Fusarium fujikuroi IMI 58289]|uniref:Uncharacterized protein n=1 Tax=Gibberella fujikuroi (strain CBS 195.34 / IMI 58289 / NRRL A-6831) TaxID=1279085 RepID=S0E325_GIBF5|nr:uncharacterized protein FFUJ_13281 [Fusarium fujikuroi IMI 58289]CCT67098.1 uncharacterized protein FFUJ_13281 [Fusarium fujikuroi IMI 58289]SCN95973.1 uncharacterized protein FFM5_06279 [Fusarium fujikuroi]SCO40905.1 uncharacterized protein FFMR_06036 [Fusarium fujikuroi]